MASTIGNIIPPGVKVVMDTTYKSIDGDKVENMGGVDPIYWSGNSSDVSSTGLISGTTWTSQTTSILDTDNHSIFFKIKFNSNGTYPNGFTGSWNKIFEFTGSSGDRSPGVWRYPNERRIHWRYNPSNTGIDFYSNTANNAQFTIGEWYFIGVTKSGANGVSYVNGVQNSSISSLANPKQTGSSTIRLFPGYPTDLAEMNNLYIWDRTLSSAEVTQLWNTLKNHMGFA